MPYKEESSNPVYRPPQNWDDMQYDPWRGDMADMMEAVRSAVLERMAVASGALFPCITGTHITRMNSLMTRLQRCQIGGTEVFDFCQMIDACMDALIYCSNEAGTTDNPSSNYYSQHGLFVRPDIPFIYEQGNNNDLYLYYNFITPSWLLGVADRNWKIPLAECHRGSIPSKFVEVFEKVRNALNQLYKFPCQLWGYIVGAGGYSASYSDFSDVEQWARNKYQDAIDSTETPWLKLVPTRVGITNEHKYVRVHTSGNESRPRYSGEMLTNELKIRGVVNAFPDCEFMLKGAFVCGEERPSDTELDEVTYNGPWPKYQPGEYTMDVIQGPEHTFDNFLFEFPDGSYGTLEVPSPGQVGHDRTAGFMWTMIPYGDFSTCFKFFDPQQ